MIPTTPKTSKIYNNLEALNYCLDKTKILFSNPDAVFVKVIYTITALGKTYVEDTLFALLNGSLQVDPGAIIQPYAVLTNEQISQFLYSFKLDIAPVLVDIDCVFQNGSYEDLETFKIPGLKFHAGNYAAIPKDGAIVERSLNYNSVLPLAYRFPTQNINFNFQGVTKTIDKQAESSADNIFQLMFFQLSGELMPPPQFSEDFSDEFTTGGEIWDENPFYQYQEGFIHSIESSYTIKGINFPQEFNAWNVMWLDDSNIFRAITFTGDWTKNQELTHYLNSNATDFRQKKAGTDVKNKPKIETGWILNSEKHLINSLVKSKRAWIFGDKILDLKEAICISEKLPIENSKAQTINYELDFEINE